MKRIVEAILLGAMAPLALGAILLAVSLAFSVTGYAWLGTAAPSSPSAPTPGLTCTAASTCGTGFAAWSESPAAFTWASFASPTWAMNPTTGMPLIEMQAN